MNLSIQNKTRIAFGLVGIMIFLAFYWAEKSDGTLSFRVKGDTAYVYGGTNSTSYGVTKDFLNENPDVQHLVLRIMPGTEDAETNLRIARLIRERGLTTHLERRSRIASGAVDLFIAGSKRTMECGALIGVHSWSFDGKIGPKDIGVDRNQSLHEGFLDDMGIDTAFYVFTREAAPPEDIYFMQYGEIERFGLLTEPAGCKT